MDLKEALTNFAEQVVNRTSGIETAIDDLVAALTPEAPAAPASAINLPAA